MSHFVNTEADTKEHSIFVYEGIDKEGMALAVHNLMQQEGYVLAEGQSGNATYTKGNRTMRILLGAFHKFFKWNIQVIENQEGTKVRIKKESSGMSGGLIGMNQVKKEYQRLAALIRAL